MLQQVYEEALNSAGVAEQEQEKWANSIEAKLNRIGATFESISSNLLSSETFKNALDLINKLLDKIDSLTKSGLGAIPIFTTLSSVMGAMGSGFVDMGNLFNAKSLIGAYNDSLTMSAENQKKFANSIALSNPAFYNYIKGLNGANAGMKSYGAYLVASTAKTIALKAATVLLNTAINAAIGAIVGLIATGISKWVNAEKELNEQIAQRISNTEDSLESLDDYAKSIESIVNSEDSEVEKIKQLNDIKDNLSTKYRREIDDINDVADARQNLINIINHEKLAELQDFYRQTIGDYADKSKQLLPSTTTEDGETTGGGWNLSQMTAKNVNVKDVRKEVTALLKDYNVQGDNLGFVIEVGDDVDQYYQNLKKTSEELTRLQTISGEKWTESEMAIYDAVSAEIDRIENLYYGEDSIYENTMRKAQNYANLLIQQMPKDETQTFAEYKAILYNLVDANKSYGEGAYFVKKAIDDLVGSTSKLNSVTSEVDPELAAIISNFNTIKNTCDTLATSIDEADEKFEKLTKTIEDNKDTSKFFSASDIIELLETYPELADSVLECAYGYKIEEEALESLRQAKLDEKKTALQTQLDEAQSLLIATENKLDAYGSELQAISSVADAKVKLAELEAQLASISGSNNPYQVSPDYVKQQIASVQEYIRLKESCDEYQKTINKLDVELQVLGTTHDDLKDATSDATKSLNAEKDAINELKDAYSDAKDAIEDLIDLTMDMIM